jgi:serine/threonine-protein kinase
VSAYRVDRELGRGGMAVVYAGWHETLDRPVALKVLAAHLADDPQFRARFLREARIAARLNHPNLVRTYDITEHDGLPCIVMELVPGGTLEGGRLTRAEAAQVAAGLAFAHANGVVHRDLKPANILRGASGEPKLADFGIARALDDTRLTEAGAIVGTLRYLAPEQAAGRTAGPEADVYALGVVLDELLAERDPSDRELVARCEADDPAERPTAADVAAELGDDTGVAATRVLHRPRRRLRLVTVAAVVAVGAEPQGRPSR